MTTVEVNGTALHCRVESSGSPAFLLCNGMGLPLEAWDELAALIAQRSRVIRFDPRGLSRSRPPEQPFSLETMAEDGVALLDHSGIERAVVAGHAFGGRVAQVLARDHPERVAGLVVCGTGGQFPPAPSPAFAALQRPEIERASWDAAFVTAYCGAAFATQQPNRALLLLDMVWQERQRGGRVRLQREAAGQTPSPSYWATATMPALLVYGTEDKNGTRQNAEDLAARLPDARLVYVEGAGHMAIAEQPQRVFAAIETFMQEQRLWS